MLRYAVRPSIIIHIEKVTGRLDIVGATISRSFEPTSLRSPCSPARSQELEVLSRTKQWPWAKKYVYGRRSQLNQATEP